MLPRIIFGRNSSPTTSYTDIWAQAIVRTLPSSAVILGASSSDANDTSAGTGARTIKIVGLDSNYEEIEETITLNGQTKVETTNSFLRVNDVVIVTAGSGETNAGTIYVYDTSDTVTAGVPQTATKIFGRIAIGTGQALMGMRTISSKEKRSIKRIIVSAGITSATAVFGKVQLQIKNFGETWQTYALGAITCNGTTEIIFRDPISLPSKSEFRFQVATSAASEVNIIIETDNSII